jgi:hypothetical protein
MVAIAEVTSQTDRTRSTAKPSSVGANISMNGDKEIRLHRNCQSRRLSTSLGSVTWVAGDGRTFTSRLTALSQTVLTRPRFSL